MLWFAPRTSIALVDTPVAYSVVLIECLAGDGTGRGYLSYNSWIIDYSDTPPPYFKEIRLGGVLIHLLCQAQGLIFFVNHNDQQSWWRWLKTHQTVLFGPSTWMCNALEAESRLRPNLTRERKKLNFRTEGRHFYPTGDWTFCIDCVFSTHQEQHKRQLCLHHWPENMTGMKMSLERIWFMLCFIRNIKQKVLISSAPIWAALVGRGTKRSKTSSMRCTMLQASYRYPENNE